MNDEGYTLAYQALHYEPHWYIIPRSRLPEWDGIVAAVEHYEQTWNKWPPDEPVPSIPDWALPVEAGSTGRYTFFSVIDNERANP